MKRLAAALMLVAAPVEAAECRDEVVEAVSYTICEVDARREDLRLFLYDDAGEPYGQFTAIGTVLAPAGQRLEFAMNAGMFHEDRAPVGHYVEDGQEIMRVIPNAGPGNFGLLPNGILCLRDGSADVIETRRYLKTPPNPACRDATQSGPMLVIDGDLHPRFLVDSTSRYIRNGVGTTADGTRAVFAISNQPVTFHEFGRLYRDHLELPQALYFDGNVSRLHAPALGRSDPGRQLGPIIGTVVQGN